MMPSSTRCSGESPASERPFNSMVPPRRRNQTGDGFQGRRFAGAICSDQSDDLAGIDVHIKAAQRRNLARILRARLLRRSMAHFPCSGRLRIAVIGAAPR